MAASEKSQFLGACVGAACGAIGWMVVLGIAIRELLLIVVPPIWAIVGVYAALRIYVFAPPHRNSAIGVALLWFIVLNVIALNVYYESIPNTIWGFSTGKDVISLPSANLILGAVTLLGCWLLLKNYLRQRQRRP